MRNKAVFISALIPIIGLALYLGDYYINCKFSLITFEKNKAENEELMARFTRCVTEEQRKGTYKVYKETSIPENCLAERLIDYKILSWTIPHNYINYFKCTFYSEPLAGYNC